MGHADQVQSENTGAEGSSAWAPGGPGASTALPAAPGGGEYDEYGLKKPPPPPESTMLPTARAGARLGGVEGAFASFGGLLLDEFTPFGADGLHVPGMLGDYYEAGKEGSENYEYNEKKKKYEEQRAQKEQENALADQQLEYDRQMYAWDPSGQSPSQNNEGDRRLAEDRRRFEQDPNGQSVAPAPQTCDPNDNYAE